MCQYFFLIWPILETRAKIPVIFLCIFGKFKTAWICSEINWHLTCPVWTVCCLVLLLLMHCIRFFFLLHVTHLVIVHTTKLLNYLSIVIPLFSCFQSTKLCRYIIYFPIISLKNSCQVRNFTRNCTSIYFDPILKVGTWTWRGLGRVWIFNCKPNDPSALGISIFWPIF